VGMTRINNQVQVRQSTKSHSAKKKRGKKGGRSGAVRTKEWRERANKRSNIRNVAPANRVNKIRENIFTGNASRTVQQKIKKNADVVMRTSGRKMQSQLDETKDGGAFYLTESNGADDIQLIGHITQLVNQHAFEGNRKVHGFDGFGRKGCDSAPFLHVSKSKNCPPHNDITGQTTRDYTGRGEEWRSIPWLIT